MALPCVLVVHLMRGLSATEVALLALLELVFGIAWAWIFAGEALGPGALMGSALVLLGVVLNRTDEQPDESSYYYQHRYYNRERQTTEMTPIPPTERIEEEVAIVN